jgi:SAM-dependent methyltransferase
MKQTSPGLQVGAAHYEFAKYVEPHRWASFWYQIHEVLRSRPSSVLEIGVGSGITKNLLAHLGIRVETVDIDIELCPSCVASVLQLPFVDCSFDTVACFQVLEHLPYDQFVPALREIRRVCRDRAIISLPDARFYLRLQATLPYLGTKRFGCTVPRPKERKHTFDGEHYWEVGKRGYPLRLVQADAESAGFEIVREYRMWDHPYHHVFVLMTVRKTLRIPPGSRKQARLPKRPL